MKKIDVETCKTTILPKISEHGAARTGPIANARTKIETRRASTAILC
jgi:hypothetical protein